MGSSSEGDDALQSEHAHPSRWTGIFSMWPDTEGEDDWPAHWGRRTSASVITLRYLSVVCDNFIKINDFIPFEGHGCWSRLIERNMKDPVHQQIVAGRLIIDELQKFVSDRIQTEMFHVPLEALEPVAIDSDDSAFEP